MDHDSISSGHTKSKGATPRPVVFVDGKKIVNTVVPEAGAYE